MIPLTNPYPASIALNWNAIFSQALEMVPAHSQTKMKVSFRRKRMGVTPAIATMVLISGTMVLALVVGAYSYSLFKPNVARIVLTSALLYGGTTTDNLTVRATASLTLFLKNPDVTTNISSINLADSGVANPITSWSVSPTSAPGNELSSRRPEYTSRR